MNIAEAWNQMCERQPVRPEEIHGLVNLVLQELLTAALKNPDAQPDSQGTIQLPHRIAVSLIQEQKSPRAVRSSFYLTGSRGQSRSIVAQATYDGPLGVENPKNLSEPTYWTPEDGPQRAWLLSNLRSQVTDFLSEIG